MKQASITDQLGIRHALIQAPMLGITTPAMVAAASEAGGLGSLPIGGLSPDKARALIRETRSLTAAPFAVNLFAHEIPAVDGEEVRAMREFLLKFCTDEGLHCEIPVPDQFRFFTYRDQLDMLLEEDIRLLSFTFGIPDQASIEAFKSRGGILVGTATCVAEARLLAERQIDAVCAQGIEAGGHRGSFLDEGELPLVGTMALVPQIIDAVPLPVIAAGGISDGRGIRAALALGAAAVQVGTAFIACTESSAIPSYKARLQTALDTDSELTRAFSGRWARGIRNRFMEALEQAGIAVPPYPVQNTLTAQLRAAAQREDRHELSNLWAGQAVRGGVGESTAAVFGRLLQEAGMAPALPPGGSAAS